MIRPIFKLPTPEYYWISNMLKVVKQYPETKPFFLNLRKGQNILDTSPQIIRTHPLIDENGHTGGTFGYTVFTASRILQQNATLRKDNRMSSPYKQIIKRTFGR